MTIGIIGFAVQVTRPFLSPLFLIVGTKNYLLHIITTTVLSQVARIIDILYNLYMKIVTTTMARKNICKILNRVKYFGEVFAIGRRDSIDALLIKFPNAYNEDLNEITNINANSNSFDFLSNEPEIYSVADLRIKYE
jgi:hypothetical protein